MSISYKPILISDNGQKPQLKVRILPSFAGLYLYLELTLSLLFEIQDRKKNKNKLENHGKISSLEELKELRNQEDDF